MKPKRILLLFDYLKGEEEGLLDSSFSFKGEEWETERHVYKALQELSSEVLCYGLYSNIELLMRSLEVLKPDLVFNLCESFSQNRNFEAHIVSLLELIDIPFTGAHSRALQIAKDKSLAKKLMNYHKIRSASFVVSRRKRPMSKFSDLKAPFIVKPLRAEGSEGISSASFCKSLDSVLERCRYIHEKMEDDAIVEEFIEGRELYVSFLGGDRPKVFPPRELFMKKGEGAPKFATFNAKWDMEYRKKWNIRSAPAKLNDLELKRIKNLCIRIAKVFQIHSYARLDLRMAEDGALYVLELNPNPNIASDDEFARSAQQEDWDYVRLIKMILNIAQSEKKAG